MRRLAPDLRLVYLLDRVHPAVRDGVLPAGAQIAGIRMSVLRDRPAYVSRLHAAGNAVHVWTVDEPDDVRRCLDAQVDAIITNRPRQVLEQLAT
jgi:glycerophosphoryl diester phosphodiesterase